MEQISPEDCLILTHITYICGWDIIMMYLDQRIKHIGLNILNLTKTKISYFTMKVKGYHGLDALVSLISISRELS